MQFAADPYYFALSVCNSQTATVTYTRAPELKSGATCPEGTISWATIFYKPTTGAVVSSQCKKVNTIPVGGTVTLVRFDTSLLCHG
jgi:hypothetical protein